MADAKHTPGPWNDYPMATKHFSEAKANRRLAIAAPELLAAAQLGATYDDLLRRYSGPLQMLTAGDSAEIDAAYDNWVSATRAAIAKATGGAA